ncbi:MAG: hypothetical protein KBT46_08070 [Ruminococcus sp.]|nr:hypothetical protein [Candidatus Copronaster equi]
MEERIEKKLAELAEQKEQVLAQLNAIIGAEMALKNLLEPEKKIDEKAKDERNEEN